MNKVEDKNYNAFPLVWLDDQQRIRHVYQGMTLEDYFVGQALPGILSSRDASGRGGFTDMDPEEIVESCYKIVEALLQERKNRRNS